MANALIQPRPAGSAAWRHWLSRGFELVSRKWPAWVGLTSACCLLSGAVAASVEPVAMFFTLALGYNLAVAVDDAPEWAGVAARFSALLRGAALFGAQAGLFVALANWPLDAAQAAAALGLPEGPALVAAAAVNPAQAGLASTLAASYERSANGLAAWAMLLPVGFGFLYPLRALGLGFIPALQQGRRAVALNRKAILFVAGLSLSTVLALLGLGLSPLIPLALGFWMAVNHVMFRDIFLGRRDNRPLPATSVSQTPSRWAGALARWAAR